MTTPKPVPKKRKAKTGTCHFCSKEVTSMDFCHGCHVHICESCDTNPDRGWGQHTPDDHRLDEDEEFFRE